MISTPLQKIVQLAMLMSVAACATTSSVPTEAALPTEARLPTEAPAPEAPSPKTALAEIALSNRLPDAPLAVSHDVTPGASAESNKVYIAVTVDDLPAHGPLLKGQTLLDVHRQLIAVLSAHRVPKVHGFVNAAKMAEHVEGRAVLEQWRDAGFQLGNHTWSHADIDRVTTAQFIEEIARNDRALAELVGDDDEARKARRWFRYPYLHQGKDDNTLAAVRNYLNVNGYRVADVSIDFGDWAYNAPFARCAEKRSLDAIESLRADYMQQAEGALLWSRATARGIFGRDIGHVLLLHSGAFDAAMLDALLTKYEQMGAVWVTLDEAQRDQVYGSNTHLPLTWGGGILERLIERDDYAHPPFLVHSSGLLQYLCQ